MVFFISLERLVSLTKRSGQLSGSAWARWRWWRSLARCLPPRLTLNWSLNGECTVGIQSMQERTLSHGAIGIATVIPGTKPRIFVALTECHKLVSFCTRISCMKWHSAVAIQSSTVRVGDCRALGPRTAICLAWGLSKALRNLRSGILCHYLSAQRPRIVNSVEDRRVYSGYNSTQRPRIGPIKRARHTRELIHAYLAAVGWVPWSPDHHFFSTESPYK